MNRTSQVVEILPGAREVASNGDTDAACLVQVNNLAFSDPRSGTPILTGATFDVRKGNRIAVLGARRSGRSLLVRLLAGDVQPTSGRICRRARVSFPLGEAPPCGAKSSPIGTYIREAATAYGADPAEVADYFDQVDYLGFDPATPWQRLQPTDGKKLGIALGLAIPFDVYLFDDFTSSWVSEGVLARMFAYRKARNSFVMTTRIVAGLDSYATHVALIRDSTVVAFSSVKEGVLSFRNMSNPQQVFMK